MLVQRLRHLGVPGELLSIQASIHPPELSTVRRVLNSWRMDEPSKTLHIGPQLGELPASGALDRTSGLGGGEEGQVGRRLGSIPGLRDAGGASGQVAGRWEGGRGARRCGTGRGRFGKVPMAGGASGGAGRGRRPRHLIKRLRVSREQRAH